MRTEFKNPQRCRTYLKDLQRGDLFQRVDSVGRDGAQKAAVYLVTEDNSSLCLRAGTDGDGNPVLLGEVRNRGGHTLQNPEVLVYTGTLILEQA